MADGTPRWVGDKRRGRALIFLTTLKIWIELNRICETPIMRVEGRADEGSPNCFRMRTKVVITRKDRSSGHGFVFLLGSP